MVCTKILSPNSYVHCCRGYLDFGLKLQQAKHDKHLGGKDSEKTFKLSKNFTDLIMTIHMSML